MIRPTFDTVWLNVAVSVSERGTCPRLRVGAVIVDADNKIVSTGYNGAPSGHPHCSEGGCLTEMLPCRLCDSTGRLSTSPIGKICHQCNGIGRIGDVRCKRAVHAELNAILQSDPLRRKGGTIYVTHLPCPACSIAVVQADLKRIVFLHHYDSTDPSLYAEVRENLYKAGIHFDWFADLDNTTGQGGAERPTVVQQWGK